MDRAFVQKAAIIASFALVFAVYPSPALASLSTVNAILGDESFVNTFGFAPGSTTDEDLRVSTHLGYVEALLSARDVSRLSVELQAARRKNLERLHRYWTRGVFPRNHDYPGTRKPCFIDRDGRICAVDYLIEQSAGRWVAETINSLFQHELITEMQWQALEEWIAQSGLTKQEIAMIQPCYGCPEEILCMKMTGHIWSQGDRQPGNELYLVGTISPTEGMFSHIPTSGELTFYMGRAIFDRYYGWANGDTTYYYRGGTFEIYEDPSSNADFGIDPPNELSPRTFIDGHPWICGTLISLSIYYARATNIFYYLSGGLLIEGGPHRAEFASPPGHIVGTLSPAGVEGYDFLWQGELHGFCGPTPVEPVTWGRIKAQYR